MHISDFDFSLPENLIAQEPVAQRDKSRLLHLRRDSGVVTHHLFRDLPLMLRAGDRIVLNDSAVLKARVFCRKEKTGGRVELLFLRPRNSYVWEALASPGRGVVAGTVLRPESRPEDLLKVHEVQDNGIRVISLADNSLSHSIVELMSVCGSVPLPPYIRRQTSPDDQQRYQTVYARNPGSVAAPTAGLHFTPQLLESVQSQGINVSYVTLHVGWGTFAPVKVEDPRNHRIHSEFYALSAKTVREIEHTKASGGKVIAVGTTTVRVLEFCAQNGKLEPSSGTCDLFILPGFEFRVVDGMVTNFHLPRSTLLMLVAAFAGLQKIRSAYEEAISLQYRFYSYGDAMLIL